MPFVAAGSNVRVNVRAGDSLIVTSDSVATLTYVAGGTLDGISKPELDSRARVYGPVAASSDVIIAAAADAEYEWFTGSINKVRDGTIVTLTAAQIAAPSAAMLADTAATYQLDVAPYTRYRSDGTNLVSVGGSGGTPDPDSVTNSLLANMGEATFKMRAAGAGTGDPIDGTAAQAKTALAIALADIADVGNLAEYAAVNPTAAGLALLDDAAASNQRTTLGLVIGTDVDAFAATASQAEAEAGTVTSVRNFTPQRIAQAIAALATGSGTAAGTTVADAAGYFAGTNVETVLAELFEGPASATLGSGTTAITHALHANRFCKVNQAGATGGTFAATATSGALEKDSFYLRNTGAGTFTASGAITAPTGFKLTAGPNEVFTADYDSDDDAWYSTTPVLAGSANAVSFIGAADYAAMRTLLALVIGTNVQAWSANLDEYAAVNPSAAGLALLDDTDAAAQRTTLSAAARAQVIAIPFAIETAADGDYVIVLKSQYGGTITDITTKCASGTATLTGKINTTALGGTANAVSSAEQSQAHASANTVVAGDDIVVTISANSAALKVAGNITLNATLA